MQQEFIHIHASRSHEANTASSSDQVTVHRNTVDILWKHAHEAYGRVCQGLSVSGEDVIKQFDRSENCVRARLLLEARVHKCKGLESKPEV